MVFLTLKINKGKWLSQIHNAHSRAVHHTGIIINCRNMKNNVHVHCTTTWSISAYDCSWNMMPSRFNHVDLINCMYTVDGFISPPPVKPEGTIGLHSVCLSVRPSVCPSHYFFENGFRTITDSVIHLWSWNFIHLLPMSQGCALLILGSKGQRSRSWRMVIWKWFPDDNWLCNQPMIMKLHTLTHHESRMCPIDFEVKRSKVKVMAHGYLKMVSGR